MIKVTNTVIRSYYVHNAFQSPYIPIRLNVRLRLIMSLSTYLHLQGHNTLFTCKYDLTTSVKCINNLLYCYIYIYIFNHFTSHF
ncbi:Myocyte-specific enhancer factor 2C [Schistosoma japonicum]|nr:Myocyte-specific enhancer factor 2C [Schistosoma japonicum]